MKTAEEESSADACSRRETCSVTSRTIGSELVHGVQFLEQFLPQKGDPCPAWISDSAVNIFFSIASGLPSQGTLLRSLLERLEEAIYMTSRESSCLAVDTKLKIAQWHNDLKQRIWNRKSQYSPRLQGQMTSSENIKLLGQWPDELSVGNASTCESGVEATPSIFEQVPFGVGCKILRHSTAQLQEELETTTTISERLGKINPREPPKFVVKTICAFHFPAARFCFHAWARLTGEPMAKSGIMSALRFRNGKQQSGALRRDVFQHWYAYLLTSQSKREMEIVRNRVAGVQGLLNKFSATMSQQIELKADQEYVAVRDRTLSTTLEESLQIRQHLQAKFDRLNPARFATLLFQVVEETMLRRGPAFCSQGNQRSRWAFLAKDFSSLYQDQQGEISCEDLLMRWINYLLLDCKMTVSALDSDDTENWNRRAPCTRNDVQRYSKALGLAKRVPMLKQGIGKELQDGNILAVLCVALRTHRNARGFDPDDLRILEKPTEARVEEVCSCLAALAPTARAQHVIDPTDISSGNSQILMLFLSALFLGNAPGLNVESDAPTRYQASDFGERVFRCLDAVAGNLAYVNFQDPSLLVKHGESVADLLSLPLPDLLLRWVNLQLENVSAYAKSQPRHSSRPSLSKIAIKNFGEDLSGGIALMHLLFRTAPNIAKACESNSHDLGTQEGRADWVLDCARRLPMGSSLSRDALLEGQEDQLMSFVAALFCVRPCLDAQSSSVLMKSVLVFAEVLEWCFRHMRQTANGAGENPVMDYCRFVRGKIPALKFAQFEINAARTTMETLLSNTRRRLCKFHAKRVMQNLIHGQIQHRRGSWSPLDQSQRIQFALQSCLRPQLWAGRMGKYGDVECQGSLVRRILRARTRFIVDVFIHYGVTSPDGEIRLPLDSMERVCAECNLFCPCTGLHPALAEALYLRLVAEHAPDDCIQDGLNPFDFLRWILQVAKMKNNSNGLRFGLTRGLNSLFEDHLQPFLCKGPKDTFDRVCVHANVRACLSRHNRLLHDIFEAHAQAPTFQKETCVLGEPFALRMNRRDFITMLADAKLFSPATASERRRCLLKVEDARNIFHKTSERSASHAISTRSNICENGSEVLARTGRLRRSFSLPPPKGEANKQGSSHVYPQSRVGSKSESADEDRSGESSSPADMRFSDFKIALVTAALYRNPFITVEPDIRVSEFIEHFIADLGFGPAPSSAHDHASSGTSSDFNEDDVLWWKSRCESARYAFKSRTSRSRSAPAEIMSHGTSSNIIEGLPPTSQVYQAKYFNHRQSCVLVEP